MTHVPECEISLVMCVTCVFHCWSIVQLYVQRCTDVLLSQSLLELVDTRMHTCNVLFVWKFYQQTVPLYRKTGIGQPYI